MADIYGTSGDDNLNGTSDTDNIIGYEGNDTLQGGEGNDYLDGGQGDDVLEGGAGDDVLQDYQGGSDTYRWGVGSGQDTVYEFSGVTPGAIDRIQITGTVAPSDVTITRELNVNPNAITLRLATGESLTVQNYFMPEGQIEEIAFSDGTVWDATAIQARIQTSLTGTEFNDYLYGTPQVELIQGLGGDDQIYAQEGNDTLQGGEGNDYLDGGQGDDVLEGGAGNDTMVDFGGGNDTYVWGPDSGQDVMYDYDWIPENIDTIQVLGATPSELTITRDLFTNPNSLTLQLTATGDSFLLGNWFQVESQIEQIQFADGTIWGVNEILARIQEAPPPPAPTEGDDILTGTPGTDVINGLGGNDQISGLAGNDTLTGGLGADMLFGGDGDDTLIVDAQDTIIQGESGYDTVLVTGSEGITLDLTLAGVEQATGASGNDVITASGTASITVHGEEGNDILTGGSGQAFLYGGNGNDKLTAGSGYYNLLDGGAGADELRGGDSNDILYADHLDTVIDGGAGIDWIEVRDTQGVTLDLGAANIEIAYGGVGGDTFTTSGSEAITAQGWNGDDVIRGGAGNDYLYGDDPYAYSILSTGNDDVAGGGGDDYILGGAGNDILSGDEGNDILHGDHPVPDTQAVGGDDVLQGGAGDDQLYGDIGNDLLEGGMDTDVLYGGFGDDTLRGGSGFDTMVGGTGDDTYEVDHDGDVVTEGLNAGVDTVRSSVAYRLGANVENLILTGTENLIGTGNELNNVLIGNSAANLLIGGAGADTMMGGLVTTHIMWTPQETSSLRVPAKATIWS